MHKIPSTKKGQDQRSIFLSKAWEMLPADDHEQATLQVSACCPQLSICYQTYTSPAFVQVVTLRHCSQRCGPVYSRTQEHVNILHRAW